MHGDIVGRVTGGKPAELEGEIADQLRMLAEDQDFRKDAAEAGIDLDAFDALDHKTDLFVVEQKGDNFGGIGEAILIKVAVNLGSSAASALALLIWQKIIKPALTKGARTVMDSR